jgi:hypothetical protein
MTGDLIYAWDDKTARMVPIGTAIFDGTHFATKHKDTGELDGGTVEGLIPDRSERRDSRWISHVDNLRSGQILTVQDLAAQPSNSWTTQRDRAHGIDRTRCSCGGRKTRTARRCTACRKVRGWNGDAPGRPRTWLKRCPVCQATEIRVASKSCRACERSKAA